MRQHARIRLGVVGRNGSAGISQPDAVKQSVAHVAFAAAPHAATQTSSADMSRARVRARARDAEGRAGATRVTVRENASR